MENQNKVKTENLSVEYFFTQLEQLLQNAPEEIMYAITAMEDPHNDNDNEMHRTAICVSGSPKKLSYLFYTAFENAPHFKDLVHDSLQVYNLKNGFRANQASSLFDVIFGQSTLKK